MRELLVAGNQVDDPVQMHFFLEKMGFGNRRTTHQPTSRTSMNIDTPVVSYVVMP